MTLHTDRAGLAAPLTGTLYEGRAARTHGTDDPLQYESGPEHRDMDGLRSIAEQLPGTLLTLEHPPGLLRDGTQGVIVGRVVSARIDGDHVVASFMVHDPRGLDAIAGGTHELSLGYGCTLDEARYQRGIMLDHLAIVPRARCGPSCSLRADSAEVEVNIETCACQLDKTMMAKERNALEGGQFAVSETRQLPINDPEHVRAAMSRFGQTHFPSPDAKKTAFHKIMARAKHFGIETTGFEERWREYMDEHEECPCGGKSEETCACKTHATYSDDMSDANKNKADEANVALDAARNELTVMKAQLDTANAALEVAKTEIAALKAQPDVTAALANLDAAKTRAEIEATNATAALAAETARATKAESELADLKTQSRKDADDAFNARVDARVELLAAAKAVGLENAKTMNDRDIKVAVIKHVDGLEVAAEKSMDYVDGVFAGALDRHAKSAGSRSDTLVAIQQMRNDGAALPNTSADDERAARVAAANRTSSAWMTSTDKRN